MKIKTKKAIAKEFLYLMFCISICIVVFAFSYLYNFYHETKIDNLTEKLSVKTILIDSLSKCYNEKSNIQFQFTKSIFTEAENESIDEDTLHKVSLNFWSRMYDKALKDSIDYWWENKAPGNFLSAIQHYGLQTSKEFKNFIIVNQVSETDIENYKFSFAQNKSKKNIQENIIIHNDKILGLESQISLLLRTLLILTLICFPLRYLISAIKWSVKMLKTKDN